MCVEIVSVRFDLASSPGPLRGGEGPGDEARFDHVDYNRGLLLSH